MQKRFLILLASATVVLVALAIVVLASGDRGVSRAPPGERALQAKLKDTQTKLASLTGKDQANAPANLTSEQTKAIEEFRGDMVQTRRQLRDVQAALRSDIRRLKAGLEFLNIALIPIIVAAVAIILGALRVRRRRRRTAEA